VTVPSTLSQFQNTKCFYLYAIVNNDVQFRKPKLMAVVIRCTDHATPSLR
jgi:hypothetical protein